MKKGLLYFIFFIGIAANIFAQDIRFQLITVNSDCNGANNGQADVIVDQIHPPYTYLWNFGNTNHSISSLAPGTYSVTVTDSLERDTVITVVIAEKECEITATLVFTPNADGINDTWTVNNLQYYPNNMILVYNRWGQKVYEHKGEYEPWDGKDLLGVPLPDNSYYYIIYGDTKDEKSIIKGSVSILR